MAKLEVHPDVLISSRVRLARNLEGYPFPEWAGSKQLEDIRNKIGALAKEMKLSFVPFEKLTEIQKKIFVEKNLADAQFIKHDSSGKALLANDRENLTITVNEEDHLRIQSLENGHALSKAWKQADKADDYISSQLPMAFSQTIGYYTACPTNLGTALRASVKMHTPAIVLTKRIYSLVKTLNEKGISVKGMFGEGTVAFGNTFQISNQQTLGLTEEQIIKLVNAGCHEILKTEMASRRNLLKRDRIYLEDNVKRALGILKYAVILSEEEALELLSAIKLGISLEIIKGKSKLKKINQLSTKLQTAHLCRRAKKELKNIEEKKVRARLVRTELELSRWLDG